MIAKQVAALKAASSTIWYGNLMEDVMYGVTSLAVAQASPAQLFELVCAHWNMENGLPNSRVGIFREYHWRPAGQGGRAIAVLNNLVLRLLCQRGVDKVPNARRPYAAYLEEAVALALCSPALV